MDNYSDMFDKLERAFDVSRSGKSYMNVSSRFWKPLVDIYETDSHILVFMEIAGVNKEDIELTYENGYLTIAGHRQPLCPHEKTKPHRLEMDAGKFFRKIRINIDIDQNRIEAEYRDGILFVTLPKRIDI